MAKRKQSKMSYLNRSIILIAINLFVLDLCAASPLGNIDKDALQKVFISEQDRKPRKFADSNVQSQICKTSGCAEAAEMVLKNMDRAVDPCDNFYQFACGTFLKNTIIPEDESSVSLFAKKNDVLQDKLKRSIEAISQENDPKTFKSLKSYYDICMDTEKAENSSLKEVTDILNKLGGWPVLVGKSWNESSFDWKTIIYQLRKLGYVESMKTIVRFDVEIDQKNTTRYLITLDQASTGIDQEYLSKGIEEKIVQAYYKYMLELAKILGADHKEAEKELTESLNFEIALAKISLAEEERRNMSQLYNLKTIRELQSEYPYIPWEEYLNQMVSPQLQLNLEDEVIVIVPSFLKSLSELISKTPKRVLANYLIWRVVEESVFYMNEQARNAKADFRASLTGTNMQPLRWVQCIEYLSNNMRVPSGALYVRKNFDNESKSNAENLVNELRKSFESILNKIDWMDEKTKEAARSKLKSIRAHVAYPDEFFDNEKLDEHFGNLKADSESFLKSHLRLNLFNLDYQLGQLGKPVDKSNWLDELRGDVATVNAFYAPAENSVQIPAGILQGEFFSSSRPNYMNYAAIGWIIGHELTHGFDDQGSQYDKDGNLLNWWDPESQKEYFKRAQCVIDQYGNYTVKELGLNVNGKNTQGENIADNGGAKEAYSAYENYEKQNGEELRLPGLPYSPRQMFWISGANAWCVKYRPEFLKNRVLTDEHSPGEFRVIGTLSNTPQFAKDFNCPAGSPMNPVKKCTVW